MFQINVLFPNILAMFMVYIHPNATEVNPTSNFDTPGLQDVPIYHLMMGYMDDRFTFILRYNES